MIKLSTATPPVPGREPMHARRHVRGALAVTALLVAIPLALSAQTRAIVFTAVTVIDATGAPAQPAMTVVIRDGAIQRIGRTGRVSAPTGPQRGRATGNNPIPGSWECHAQRTPEASRPWAANASP